MENPIFLQLYFEQSVAKVGAPITNNCPWGAKTREYILFQECKDTLPFIVCEGDGFDPFRYIINRYQNVLHSMRTHKRAHKVNIPKHQITQSQEQGLEGALAFLKCHHIIGIDHMLQKTHEHLDEELANSNHIVISYERFGYRCDIHQRVRNGMPPTHSTSHILENNAE